MIYFLVNCLFIFCFVYTVAAIVNFSIDSADKKKKDEIVKIRSLHLSALYGNEEAEKEWKDLLTKP